MTKTPLRKTLLILVGIFLIGVLVSSNCSSTSNQRKNPSEIFKTNEEYRAHYKLNFKKIKYNHWYFKSDDYKIFTQSFMPPKRKGIVLILHGYLSHSGIMKDMVSLVLQRGYGVILYDLPGHGLSSGKSVDCVSFHDYGNCLNDFIKEYNKRYSDELLFMGHSTGCASYVDYSMRYKSSLKKVFFAAPLVRSYLWHPSIVLKSVASVFTDSIGRHIGDSTSNKEYLKFIRKNDPLQAKSVPFHWVTALSKWNDELKNNNNVMPQSIVIIQGADDKVVDYKYNLKKLKQFYPNSKTALLKNLRHDLFNETGKNREVVHRHVKEFLK